MASHVDNLAALGSEKRWAGVATDDIMLIMNIVTVVTNLRDKTHILSAWLLDPRATDVYTLRFQTTDGLTSVSLADMALIEAVSRPRIRRVWVERPSFVLCVDVTKAGQPTAIFAGRKVQILVRDLHSFFVCEGQIEMDGKFGIPIGTFVPTLESSEAMNWVLTSVPQEVKAWMATTWETQGVHAMDNGDLFARGRVLAEGGDKVVMGLLMWVYIALENTAPSGAAK